MGAFGKCLDEYMWSTPHVDLWACLPGAANEAWDEGAGGALVNRDSGKCLSAVPFPSPTLSPAPAPACTNVWARPLASGATALALVSNDAAPRNVTCDAACFALANVTAQRVRVRDLVAHADLGVFAAPLSVSMLLGGSGDAAALLITPA